MHVRTQMPFWGGREAAGSGHLFAARGTAPVRMHATRAVMIS